MNKKLEIFGGIKFHDYHTMESVGCAEIKDFYINKNADGTTETIKRPGLRLLADMGSQDRICGLYDMPKLGKIAMVHDGQIKWAYKDLNNTVITGQSIVSSSGGDPAYFCTDGTYVYSANGGEILYSNLDNIHNKCTGDIGNIINVVHLGGFLFALSKDGHVYYTDPATLDRTHFDGRYLAPAMSGGMIMNIAVTGEYLYLMTDRMAETWYLDGSESVAGPISSKYIGTGLGAIHGVCTAHSDLYKASAYAQVNSTLFYLDTERRVCQLDNLANKIISDDIAGYLRGLNCTDDCIMRYATPEGKRWIICSFPTDGRTFVYDIDLQTWVEFCLWNTAIGDWERFACETFCFSDHLGGCIAGGRKDGGIYLFTGDCYTDNGSPIVSRLTTNCTDNGILARKTSIRIDLEMRKGWVDASNQIDGYSYLKLDSSDEAQEKWGNREVTKNIDKLGGYRSVITFNGLGSYKTRSYRITMTDNAPMTISSATEELRPLNGWYSKGGQ